MYKLFSLSVIMALALSFSIACSQQKSTPTAAEPETKTQETADAPEVENTDEEVPTAAPSEKTEPKTDQE